MSDQIARTDWSVLKEAVRTAQRFEEGAPWAGPANWLKVYQAARIGRLPPLPSILQAAKALGPRETSLSSETSTSLGTGPPMSDTPRFDLEELERLLETFKTRRWLTGDEAATVLNAAPHLVAAVKAAQETMEKFDRLYQKAYDADWEGYGEGSVWAINAFRELFAKSMTPSLAPFTQTTKEDA